jgi:murein L,D-transpeptidase YafK
MSKLKISFFVLLFFILHTSFHSVHILDNFLIVIDKDKYELNVFDTKGWLVTFPCVFGNKNQGDKMVEGDRKTPEGTFSIISKKKSKNWNSFLMLDYPTQADIQKFEERKAEGIIPPTAKIGSAIGIHGTWPHEDYTIDQYQAWTDGCIALKNVDIEELYRITPIGAKVIIRK